MARSSELVIAGRSERARTVVGLALVTTIVAACGSLGTPTPNVTAYNACSALWEGSFDSLDELNARLIDQAAPLTDSVLAQHAAEYVTRVGEIMAVMTTTNSGPNLPPDCGTVGAKLLLALQA